VEYLTGEGGGPEEQLMAAQISRLIIAGNSLAPILVSSEIDKKSVSDSTLPGHASTDFFCTYSGVMATTLRRSPLTQLSPSLHISSILRRSCQFISFLGTRTRRGPSFLNNHFPVRCLGRFPAMVRSSARQIRHTYLSPRTARERSLVPVSNERSLSTPDNPSTTWTNTSRLDLLLASP
jgi:hypothetical protein